MTLLDVLDGWLPLVGGITGVLWITYMIWMGYHAYKKDRREQRMEVALARMEGLLLGFIGRRR